MFVQAYIYVIRTRVCQTLNVCDTYTCLWTLKYMWYVHMFVQA